MSTSDFANPYLACDQCGAQVQRRQGNHNMPCGHHADFRSRCPSWSPVSGCLCMIRVKGTYGHHYDGPWPRT
jgi:hypothetical protein